MRSILDFVPQKLWSGFPTANGRVDDNGVLVAKVAEAALSRELMDDRFALLRDGKEYYVMISPGLRDDYPTITWEHVSYKYADVYPAKKGMIDQRKDDNANRAELWRNVPRNIMH